MGADQRLLQRVRVVLADTEGGVPSPCISLCRMDEAAEYCLGCRRTLDEIAGWSRMGDEERRAVWSAIGRRIAEHPQDLP